MVRPDPGRDIQERLLAWMSPESRACIGLKMRRRALLAIWRQVDERQLDDPLEQADLVLRRRYPEMPPAWLEEVLAQLELEHRMGRWHGFERP